MAAEQRQLGNVGGTQVLGERSTPRTPRSEDAWIHCVAALCSLPEKVRCNPGRLVSIFRLPEYPGSLPGAYDRPQEARSQEEPQNEEDCQRYPVSVHHASSDLS